MCEEQPTGGLQMFNPNQRLAATQWKRTATALLRPPLIHPTWGHSLFRPDALELGRSRRIHDWNTKCGEVLPIVYDTWKYFSGDFSFSSVLMPCTSMPPVKGR